VDVAAAEDHLAESLRLPVEVRARAARALLDSLDEEDDDTGAGHAHVTELIRRMTASMRAKSSWSMRTRPATG
jgi:hypothetical protein